MKNYERFGYDDESEFSEDCLAIKHEMDNIFANNGLRTAYTYKVFEYIKMHKNPDLAFFCFYNNSRAEGLIMAENEITN